MRITAIIKHILFFVIGLALLSGCSGNDTVSRAREYARKSGQYYTAALEKYKTLVSQPQQGAGYYFELGTLYYAHGDFERAIEAFKKSGQPQAKIFLAVSLYRLGDFTAALGAFNAITSEDPQYRYYYGLTCERLNLFDQALSNYRSIKDEGFKQKAHIRIEIIEKKAHTAAIQELDPFAYKIISSAPSGEKYPQAGALILYADERTEITEQNTQVSSLHYIVKILNERGKESFAETGIDYDSTFERVELEYARTIKPDGSVAAVGTRHIRDVSKYMNFPLYSNARVTIISFPEIVEGACIEYKLKIYRSQLVNKKDFDSVYPVQTQEPVIAARFQISLPEARTLAIKNINQKFNDFKAVLAPEVEKKAGRVVYRWGFKDIPQIIPEAHMPPSTEINPAIMVSTFSSWDDVYRCGGALRATRSAQARRSGKRSRS
jgi:tetratricopeptide (TPR) repeat protein